MSEINQTAAMDGDDPEGLEGEGAGDQETPTQVQKGFGVRRVNNLPVIIGGGIALGFAVIIAIVAAQKAQHNAPRPPGTASQETVADKSNSSQAEQMAATIARKAPTGIVAPLGPPTDAVGLVMPPGDQRPVTSGLAPVGSATANSEATAAEQERMRLLTLKRTQFEEAIRAPTTVAGGGGRGVGGGGLVNASYNTSGGLPSGSAPSGYPGGAGPGVSPGLLGQLNGARSQMEADRQRALATTRVLSDRLDQLSRERGVTSTEEGAAPFPPATMSSGGYVSPSSPTMPSVMSSPGSSSSSHPGFLTDAVGQFQGKDSDRWTLNSAMTVPKSPYELRAGAVIPAILISGVNSELPGQILAQLSENVYDTARGNSLLLPQGSRLIGEYSSNVGYGQGRLMVVWKRIVFPDAKALDIGAMPGTDGAGYGGMKDQVNNHYVRLFAGAVMLSAIEAAVIKSQPQAGISLYPTTSQALDQALGQQLGLTATQLIQKNMNIAPTLNIRPGYRLNVMVTKDMVFSKPYQSFDY